MDNTQVAPEKHLRHLDAIDYNAGGYKCYRESFARGLYKRQPRLQDTNPNPNPLTL